MYSQQRKNLSRGISELQSVSDTLRHGKLYSTVGYVMRMADAEPTTKGCQYIYGNPTKAQYREHGIEAFKCRKAVLVRPDKSPSPYCPHHHSICYVKPLTEDKEGPASPE